MFSLILILFLSFPLSNAAPPYGQLSVKGNKLLGSNGQPVQLAGMSLFWSNCDEGKVFYNEETLYHLKCSWNANVVRAAMGVESNGCQRPAYLDVPITEREKVEAVVKAAIKLDMYVVIDYHTEKAQDSLPKAKDFFNYFACKYGNNPNIIYEPFNEPNGIGWSGVKAYHQQIVDTIRKCDKKNVIVLGTTTWSQDVDIASRDPVNGANLCYTLHIYAASHHQDVRNKAQTALNNGVCIFVTEYGTVSASGGGEPDEASMNDWWNFWDKNKISYLNWAVDNKGEGSAALNPNTVASDVGTPSHWSKSGQIVQDHLKKMTNGVSCSGKPNNSGSSPPKSNNKNNGTVSKNKGGNNNKGGNTNNNNKNGGKISISLNVDSSWGNGANYKIIIKNTGTSAICSVTFQVTPVGKQTINVWNAKSLSGGKYSISNIKINAGGTNNEIGMGVSGSSKAPKISLINTGKC